MLAAFSESALERSRTFPQKLPITVVGGCAGIIFCWTVLQAVNNEDADSSVSCASFQSLKGVTLLELHFVDDWLLVLSCTRQTSNMED